MTGRRHNSLLAACAAAISLLPIAGCAASTTTPQPAPKYQLPENFQVDFRWSALDGADLAGQSAAVARAAAESARIVQSCGIEHGYPGYADAVAKEPANPKIWKIVLDPARLGNGSCLLERGTVFLQLVSLHQTESGFVARIRQYDFVTIERTDDGRAQYLRPSPLWTVYDLEINAKGKNDSTQLVQGPERFPEYNAFYWWSIASLTVSDAAPEALDAGQQLPPEAHDWPQALTFDKPAYPQLTPYPGWPKSITS